MSEYERLWHWLCGCLGVDAECTEENANKIRLEIVRHKEAAQRYEALSLAITEAVEYQDITRLYGDFEREEV